MFGCFIASPCRGSDEASEHRPRGSGCRASHAAKIARAASRKTPAALTQLVKKVKRSRIAAVFAFYVDIVGLRVEGHFTGVRAPMVSIHSSGRLTPDSTAMTCLSCGRGI